MGLYNVKLDSGLFEFPLFASKQVNQESIRGRDKAYFFGVQREPLSFKLSFAFNNGYTDATLRQVAAWLDQDTHKEFYFDDTPNRIINCISQGDSQLITNGLLQGYLELEFIADSSYYYSALASGNIISPGFWGSTVTFTNNGDVDLYPEMWITTGASGGISITNITDNNLNFAFDNLANNETIYCDCENQYIESDISMIYRYDQFNDNWLKLKPGVNSLLITGDFALQFRYKFKYLQGARAS
jgi:phage-related protein